MASEIFLWASDDVDGVDGVDGVSGGVGGVDGVDSLFDDSLVNDP